MEKEKRNKKRNKNNNDQDNKEENTDYSKLKEELDNYLKQNEEISKTKEKENEVVKKIKNAALEKLKELKELKENQSYEELYNKAVEEVKLHSNLEITQTTQKFKLEALTKDNSVLNENNNTLSNKIASGEKYSKMLLDKCNQLNEEKKKIIIDESEKRNELIKKCEDFMKDMQSKFEKEIPEKELLIKENEQLRKKLDETKVFIEEKLESAQKSKEMFEQSMKTGIEAEVKELRERDTLNKIENMQLKAQLNIYNQKFDELTNSVKSYNSHYELLKKEIEKVS